MIEYLHFETSLSVGMLAIFILLGLIVGWVYFKKYKKSQKVRYLIISFLLSLLIPGLLYFIYLYVYDKYIYEPSTCYLPIEPPREKFLTPLFLTYRRGSIKRIKNKIPQNVFEKISKKKD